MKPEFEGIDAVYKAKADNKDIRDLLVKLVPKAKSQMKTFAQKFKGRTPQETCKNIFDYLKNNFTYVADGNEQIIKLPSALLRKKVGDCKSFSLFTSSILENLKIPYKFVYASYSANPIPQHVYVVTENGCIIDAVYGIFNEEKKPTYKYLQDMNVRYMAGIGCSCVSGMGASGKGKAKVQQFKQNVKKDVSKAGKFVVKAGLSGGRTLVLAMIKNNLDGFASKMQKIDTNVLKKDWEKAGGKFSNLQDAIKVGASKPAKRLGLLGKLQKLVKAKGGIKGIGAISQGEIQAAIVTAATAIGGAIVPTGGEAAGASVGATLAAMYPSVAEMLKQTPATESDTTTTNDISADAAAVDGATDNSSTSFSFGTILPIIAIGGVILYFVTKKK
jgi:Transglutaminase-like superfamily